MAIELDDNTNIDEFENLTTDWSNRSDPSSKQVTVTDSLNRDEPATTEELAAIQRTLDRLPFDSINKKRCYEAELKNNGGFSLHFNKVADNPSVRLKGDIEQEQPRNMDDMPDRVGIDLHGGLKLYYELPAEEGE